MIQLADVKLVSAVRPTFQDPVALKRTKFISRVSEQLEIANHLMKGEQIPFTSFHLSSTLAKYKVLISLGSP